jgi:isoleucyl-tRNA synthetase
LEDVVITEKPKSGWTVASHDGESVALDLSLTPELIDAGHVREVIRFLQEARKNEGLDISDRINIFWNSNPEIAAALESAKDHISREVLAITIVRDDALPIGKNEMGLYAKVEKSNQP